MLRKQHKKGFSMNKRIITTFLITSLLFSLTACKKDKPIETTTSEITTITEKTTTIETTTESTTESSKSRSPEVIIDTSVETTQESIVIGKTTVTDQYKKTFKNEILGKVTARIPKVTIEGVDTKEINNEILKSISKKAKGNKCSYQYYIGKNYVSIIIEIDDSGVDLEQHYIYNISRITGKKLTQAEMYTVLEITESSYKSRVKTAIKKMWKKNGWITRQKKLYNKAISNKTINKAVLYVNKKGKVSFLVRNMNLGAGADGYDVLGTC